MRRFISLLLSLLLLCTVLLPASLAETAEEPAEAAAEEATEETAEETAEEPAEESAEKTAKDIFNDLINALGKRKVNNDEITDPAAVDACCKELYGYVDADFAERVFYGGPEAAPEILKILSTTLFNIDKYYDTALGNAEICYVMVWAMFHSDPATVAKLSPKSVKETLKHVYTNLPTEAVEAAADLCMNYIISHEPGIVNTGK